MGIVRRMAQEEFAARDRIELRPAIGTGMGTRVGVQAGGGLVELQRGTASPAVRRRDTVEPAIDRHPFQRVAALIVRVDVDLGGAVLAEIQHLRPTREPPPLGSRQRAPA